MNVVSARPKGKAAHLAEGHPLLVAQEPESWQHGTPLGVLCAGEAPATTESLILLASCFWSEFQL